MRKFIVDDKIRMYKNLIARKMLEMNLTIEQIIQITGLKIGKIKQLQKNRKFFKSRK